MVNSFLAIVGFDSTECEEDYLAVKLGRGARVQPLGEDLWEACGDYGIAAGLDLVRNNRVVGCSRQNLNVLPLLHNKRTLGSPEPWWSPGAAPSVRGHLQHPSR